jgi:hypothetical protein
MEGEVPHYQTTNSQILESGLGKSQPWQMSGERMKGLPHGEKKKTETRRGGGTATRGGWGWNLSLVLWPMPVLGGLDFPESPLPQLCTSVSLYGMRQCQELGQGLKLQALPRGGVGTPWQPRTEAGAGPCMAAPSCLT